MAVSQDLLNTTVAEIYAKGGSLVLIGAGDTTAMQYLIDKQKVNKDAVGGTYFERPFAYRSPAKGGKITNGDEIVPLLNAQSTKKYQVQAQRHMIAVSIDGLELRRNDGKLGAVKLIKDKPMQAIAQFHQDQEFWFLTGAYHDSGVSVIDAPGFDDCATLNGNVTHTGGDRGWLQQLAPASQTGKVQSVAVDSTIRHINQFGAITSFATDGMLVIDNVYDTCQAFGGGSGPDLGFADGGTYSNIVVNNRDSVRITDTDKQIDGRNSASYQLYKSARIYNALVNLDPTNAAFTGTPGFSTSSITGGILYFVNSKYVEVPYFDEVTRPPEFIRMIANQDVLTGHLFSDMNPMTLRLNSMGVIAGGRIP